MKVSYKSVVLGDYLKWYLGEEAILSKEHLSKTLESFDFLWSSDLNNYYTPTEAADILYPNIDTVIEIRTIETVFDCENHFELNGVTYAVMSIDLPLEE